MSRRSDVQGLRALAVLLVVAFHAGLGVPGGFTGVDVFFVISGFVITTSLLRSLTARRPHPLRAFYARRVKRLLPALALMLTVVTLVGALVTPLNVQTTEAKTGVAASFFAANVELYKLPTAGYFDVKSTANPFLHTWTLAVEEQFYLVFPALLLLAWAAGRGRPSRRRNLMLALVGIVSSASFVLSVALAYGAHVPGVHTPESFAFYGSPTRAWEFGAGALLAVVLGAQLRLPSFATNALALGGLALIVVGSFAIHGTDRFPGVLALLPAGGAALVIAAGAAGPSSVARLLSVPPALWIGDRSYSWYLWHWPFIVAAGNLLPGAGWARSAAAGLSIVPAAVSYRYVENPVRSNRSLQGRRVLALAVGLIAVPVAAAAGLVAANHALDDTPALRSWAQAQRLHVDFTRGCESLAPPQARDLAACTWTVARSRGRIVLVGDSNAGHLSEGVIAAGRRARFDVTLATTSGCPLVAVRLRYPHGVPTDACARFVVQTLDWLATTKPRLVIVASRTDGYVSNDLVAVAPLSGGSMTKSTTEKTRLWAQGLQRVLARLNAAGVPVVVVRPVPGLPASPGDCAVVRVLFHPCSTTVARARIDRDLRASTLAEDAAVQRAPHTRTANFENVFCGPARCFVARHGVVLYRDRTHLSVDGALALTTPLYRAIERSASR